MVGEFGNGNRDQMATESTGYGSLANGNNGMHYAYLRSISSHCEDEFMGG